MKSETPLSVRSLLQALETLEVKLTIEYSRTTGNHILCFEKVDEKNPRKRTIIYASINTHYASINYRNSEEEILKTIQKTLDDFREKKEISK